MKYPKDDMDCFRADVIDHCIEEIQDKEMNAKDNEDIDSSYMGNLAEFGEEVKSYYERIIIAN